MKNIDLVILAGGKGTRIKKLTNYPKPIVKFNNLHFLDYLIQSYGTYHLQNSLLLNHKSNSHIYLISTSIHKSIYQPNTCHIS